MTKQQQQQQGQQGQQCSRQTGVEAAAQARASRASQAASPRQLTPAGAELLVHPLQLGNLLVGQLGRLARLVGKPRELCWRGRGRRTQLAGFASGCTHRELDSDLRRGLSPAIDAVHDVFGIHAGICRQLSTRLGLRTEPPVSPEADLPRRRRRPPKGVEGQAGGPQAHAAHPIASRSRALIR